MAERLFSPEEFDALRLRFDQAEAELGQNHDGYIVFADEMVALLGQTSG